MPSRNESFDPLDYVPLSAKDQESPWTEEQRKAALENRYAWSSDRGMVDPGVATSTSSGGSSGGGWTPPSPGVTEITPYDVQAAAAASPDGYIDPNDLGPIYTDIFGNPVPATDAQPLPTGMNMRTLTEMAPGSDELATRRADAQDRMANPQEFIDANVAELSEDQTVLDKGLSFLGGLFNYQDESDLQILGINLSSVESTWDGAWQYITGGRNVLDAGITALISAMPGGVRTYEWGEITDNHSLWEVLRGDIGLMDNVGPSPMQTAITSVGIEAARIRGGEARLSDVLLFANPATAPFILAGIAAESSALQDPDFNLLDPEQRKKAFSSGGWEQWMSGIGDFGVQIASPSIGITAAAGVLSKGALGVSKGIMSAKQIQKGVSVGFDELITAYTPAGVATADFATSVQRFAAPLTRRYVARLERAGAAERYNIAKDVGEADMFWEALDDTGRLSGRSVQDARQRYNDTRTAAETRDPAVPLDETAKRDMADMRRIDAAFDLWQKREIRKAAEKAGDEIPPSVSEVWTKSSDELGLKNPLARLINDIIQTDTSGRKVMERGEIASRKELRANPNRAAISDILYNIRDPFTASAALMAMHGSADGKAILSSIAPAIMDDISTHMMTIARSKHLAEPSKVESVKKMLSDTYDSMERQRDVLLENMDAGKVVPANAAQRVKDLRASMDQIEELRRYFNGDVDVIDVVDPANPFFDPVWSERVIDDLFERMDIIDSLTGNGRLARAGMNVQKSTAMVITTDNWYARAINKRRERNARARYEYSVEGTGLLPRRVFKEVTSGDGIEVSRKWEFGWKASEFKTPTWKRAARAWMWLGTETPAGQITLKGGGLASAEKELDATLSLDLYRGQPVLVRYLKDGKWVEEMVGGTERRAEFLSMWARAMRDPSIDKKSVLEIIERGIGDDMMRAYGLSGHEKIFRDLMATADARRMRSMDAAAKNGTVVDRVNGGVENIPYLKHNLANVHVMHNWHFLESKLQRNALKYGGGVSASGPVRAFRTGTGVGADIALQLDNIFQEFWRPAVLLRLAYPQRNTFEGISRAVGFYGSLAPIAWPLVATAKGVRNVGRKVATRSGATSKFLREVGNSQQYANARVRMASAQADHDRLVTAYTQVVDEATYDRWAANELIDDLSMPAPPEDIAVRWVVQPNGKYRWMTEDEWSKAYASAADAVEEADKLLAPLQKVLDDAAGNSRFGRWRKKNIEAAEKEFEGACKAATAAALAMQAGSGAIAGADELLRANGAKQVAADTLRTLKYDGPGAVRLWREQAGRKTRIGSGTSYGPDGGLYPDAFADEFALMNAQAASSDLSRKTTLAAYGDVWSNWFIQSDMRHNVEIKYNALKPDEWISGMATQTEQWVANPLVRAMIAGDTIDVDAGIRWMLDTPEGQEFALTMRFLQGTDFEAGDLTRFMPVDEARQAGVSGPRGKVFTNVRKYSGKDPESAASAPDREFTQVDVRLAEMAKSYKNPLTGRIEYEELVDMLDAYAHVVADDLITQFQATPEFLGLLRSRARAYASGSSRPVTKTDVEDILNVMTPEQRLNLNSVIGSEKISMGTKPIMEMYKGLVNRLFNIIGTIPEDTLVRGPFYNKRFKQVRNALIEEYWLATDPDMLKSVRKGGRTKGGKVLKDEIEHPQFKIPADEIDAIYEIAHKQALMDTKEYLYTVERRTNLGKYGEHIWPFISANQNTVTAIGKILYKNPWVLPAAVRLWRAPERMGYTDENGDFILPMPFEWLNDRLKDAVNVPVIGGVLSGDAMLTMPQNGLNVWSPDTGFLGVVPRPGGAVPILASAAMRFGMFPVEPPEALKGFLGEDVANEQWQLAKDYMFGEGFTWSADNPLFQSLPAWLKRAIQTKDETSKAYVYQYALSWANEIARFNAGEIDEMPTADDIHKRTTNTMWFYVLGNQGVPTPLTPYPILSRPEIKNPTVQVLNEAFMQYQKAMGKKNENGEYIVAPGEAMRMFARDFGYDLLEVALSTTNVSESIGGAKVTNATVADIKAYDTQIRELMEGGLASIDDYRILDILINNSNGPEYEYSLEANRYLGLNNIPSVSEKWREQNTGPEAVSQTIADVGWVQYRQFMDGLDAEMQSAGVKSLESKAGIPYKNKKIAFLTNLAKAYPDWKEDYMAGAERSLPSAITLINKIATDSTIQQRMMENGQETLAANFQEYSYYRQHVAQALKEAGDNEYDRASVLEMWDVIRTDLKNRDIRWAEIANRWLDADEAPGMVYDTSLMQAFREM